MKKLIDNSGGYQTFVELRPFKNPAHEGWNSLIITTVWDGARGEVHEQRQFEINLEPESLKNLKELLNEVQEL
jgi:hypothetical protein